MSGEDGAAPQFPLEREAVRKRRATYDLDSGKPDVGLALSGGGIRSATFGLGLLRGLGQAHLLQKVDYLSTVSGGGYTGAFYCGLFARRGAAATSTAAAIDLSAGALRSLARGRSFDILDSGDAPAAIRYLRQSGRYLTPAGGRDYIYAVALVIRNWVALTLVTGVAFVLLAMLADLARAGEVRACSNASGLTWLSPALLVVAPAALAAVASGWAYWLTMRNAAWRVLHPPLFGTLAIAGIAGYAALHAGATWPMMRAVCDGTVAPLAPQLAPAALSAVATLAFLLWAGAGGLKSYFKAISEPEIVDAQAEDLLRLRLTRWLAAAASVVLLGLAVSAGDMIGFAAARWALTPDVHPLGPAALVALLVPISRRLVKRVASLPKLLGDGTASGAASAGRGKGWASGVAAKLAAPVAAAVLGTVALAFWLGLGHLLAWGPSICAFPVPWEAVCSNGSPGSSPPEVLLIHDFGYALLGVAGFVGLAAFSDGFVNLSSLATFYAARLRRAYLGAGNPFRIKDGGKSVREGDPHDDLDLPDYFERSRHGAPVHIINVTINETRGSGSATIQRDRHGRNLAISPDGASYSPTSDRTVVRKPFGMSDGRVDRSGGEAGLAPGVERPGEPLPLSTWVGISGAAFSTGLGSQTNLAYSLLAFLANVRLGCWWKQDRSRLPRPTTYANLARELVADFPGVASGEWYLTDGGHFDNTAAYELVRRRVPFVIASDNGCDPRFGFEDLANLVRKCRIDFDTDIRILDAQELDALPLGPMRASFAAPRQFLPGEASAPDAIAMLARIVYPARPGRPPDPPGTMVIVKPRMTPDGPADLARYLVDNPSFPQQTTLDQFFDEAQWESYYELGRRITARLFAPADPGSWGPARMTSIWAPA